MPRGTTPSQGHPAESLRELPRKGAEADFLGHPHRQESTTEEAPGDQKEEETNKRNRKHQRSGPKDRKLSPEMVRENKQVDADQSATSGTDAKGGKGGRRCLTRTAGSKEAGRKDMDPCPTPEPRTIDGKKSGCQQKFGYEHHQKQQEHDVRSRRHRRGQTR